MDGYTNPKITKQSIYEIYRACRLCGAGAGYKMPIIQNVVDLDSGNVELKHKVRECVQIEVHQDDKMPPLICELCVDKVNDFYEFLEMCRQTNKQTRLRLGLPPQTLPRGVPDAGDCILGVTEPIFISEDSNEPIMKTKGKTIKSSKTKEADIREAKSKIIPKKFIKKEKEVEISGDKEKTEFRTLRKGSAHRLRTPSPPRVTRGNKRPHEEEDSLKRLQNTRKSDVPMPKSILKKERESQSEERARVTRWRERANDKIAVEQLSTKKVVKIVVKNEIFKSPHKPTYICTVCESSFAQGRSLSNHMRCHAKPPERGTSPPPKKEIKKQCKLCHRQFLDRNLLSIHRCSGRPGKLKKDPYNRPEKPASKPLRTSPPKKRPSARIDPELLKQLRPLQVKISRCDPLLQNRLGDHYDVSDVDYDYGLDKSCVYPYIYTFRHLRIKSEPTFMVNIQDEIKHALDVLDSDETDSDLDFIDSKKVDTLSSMSLKSLNSQDGSFPKKRRKAKAYKAFDSILNSTNDFESNMRLGIDNIIDSLDDDKDKCKLVDNSAVQAKVSEKDDNDSLFGDDNSPAKAVTNDDFDSLYNNDVTKSNDKNTIDNKSVYSNTTNLSMDFPDDGDVAASDKSTLQDSSLLENKDINKSDDSFTSDAKNIQGNIDSVDKGENITTDDKENSNANTFLDDAKLGKETNSHKLDKLSSGEVSAKTGTDLESPNKEVKNGRNHVNGQVDLADEFNMHDFEDVRDSKMEHSSLLHGLDEQINEKRTVYTKIDASERVNTATENVLEKSMDLESISDGEFE